jgi:hypothetical protein
MRRRTLICAAGFAAIAAAVFAGYWFTRPHPRIDGATLWQIQPGMTEQQVIDIIGAPPGNYGLGHGEMETWTELMKILIEGPKPRPWSEEQPVRLTIVKDWLGPDQGIRVHFDLEGKVASAEIHAVWREYESHYDMLLVWCRLRDRKPRPVFVSN